MMLDVPRAAKVARRTVYWRTGRVATQRSVGGAVPQFLPALWASDAVGMRLQRVFECLVQREAFPVPLMQRNQRCRHPQRPMRTITTAAETSTAKHDATTNQNEGSVVSLDDVMAATSILPADGRRLGGSPPSRWARSCSGVPAISWPRQSPRSQRSMSWPKRISTAPASAFSRYSGSSRRRSIARCARSMRTCPWRRC